MKLANYFDVLLRDTVNLPQAKLDLLSQRVDSIYTALSTDAVLGGHVLDKIPQGSWAQKTIIRPRPGKEFDADFMLQLEPDQDWSATPGTYIDEVYRALKRHPVYGPMNPMRKCRCVRIVYANDFHVDIVPYLVTDTGKWIVNRDEGILEPTDPEAFTRWMRDKDDVTRGNLRKVIRLLKYLREGSTWSGTRSIILTTLLGERVETYKKIFDPGYYATVPDALLHIVSDLDDWLQARPSRPSVPDPSGTGLTFDHRWDDTTYNHFRDRIQVYRERITRAHAEGDREQSILDWQELFGPGFKAPAASPSSSGPFGTITSSAAGRSGRGG